METARSITRRLASFFAHPVFVALYLPYLIVIGSFVYFGREWANELQSAQLLQAQTLRQEHEQTQLTASLSSSLSALEEKCQRSIEMASEILEVLKISDPLTVRVLDAERRLQAVENAVGKN